MNSVMKNTNIYRQGGRLKAALVRTDYFNVELAMVIRSCVIMSWLYFSRLSVWGTPWNRRGLYKK